MYLCYKSDRAAMGIHKSVTISDVSTRLTKYSSFVRKNRLSDVISVLLLS